jgi:GNAT superfamily N-acetyltransferase
MIAWRHALPTDAAKLALWNHRLIRDEGHRNGMSVEELAKRMEQWLQSEYSAVVFTSGALDVAYALFRRTSESVYLRQFFVVPEYRRKGIGRNCFRVLKAEIWPQDLRLTVDVLCHNEAAVAFWRAMGYKDYCLTLEILPDAKSA